MSASRNSSVSAASGALRDARGLPLHSVAKLLGKRCFGGRYSDRLRKRVRDAGPSLIFEISSKFQTKSSSGERRLQARWLTAG